MSREELEEKAKTLYTKEEIELLLKGFDIGLARAVEILNTKK